MITIKNTTFGAFWKSVPTHDTSVGLHLFYDILKQSIYSSSHIEFFLQIILWFERIYGFVCSRWLSVGLSNSSTNIMVKINLIWCLYSFLSLFLSLSVCVSVFCNCWVFSIYQWNNQMTKYKHPKCFKQQNDTGHLICMFFLFCCRGLSLFLFVLRCCSSIDSVHLDMPVCSQAVTI